MATSTISKRQRNRTRKEPYPRRIRSHIVKLGRLDLPSSRHPGSGVSFSLTVVGTGSRNRYRSAR
jgi:hypothetical protein